MYARQVGSHWFSVLLVAKDHIEASLKKMDITIY